jgi:dTDP-4-dehydrorhamnose 3,5-epimerase
MRFVETPLAGLLVVEIEPIADERGFFARSYCDRTFREAGLNSDWPQTNVSRNLRRGTLRGLHYQRPPHEEVKLVRCTRGGMFDVAVDLRADSASRGRWHAVELTEDNHRALYLPAGFAHGFQSLVDGTEVLYQMGAEYHAELAGGVRWNDPTLAIDWPIETPAISARDAALPTLDEAMRVDGSGRGGVGVTARGADR